MGSGEHIVILRTSGGVFIVTFSFGWKDHPISDNPNELHVYHFLQIFLTLPGPFMSVMILLV
jgi:hypothetical protein